MDMIFFQYFHLKLYAFNNFDTNDLNLLNLHIEMIIFKFMITLTPLIIMRCEYIYNYYMSNILPLWGFDGLT